MGWFDQIFGGGQQAGFDAAQSRMREAQKYYEPYQQAGGAALGQYQTALGQIADPRARYEHLMSGYHESPAAKFQQEQMEERIRNMMGARGLAGSGAESKSLMKYGQGLISQDQEKYLKDLMGIGSQYRSGLRGLTGLGYGAAGQMGQIGQAMAPMAFGQASSKGSGLRNLIGLGMKALPMFL